MGQVSGSCSLIFGSGKVIKAILVFGWPRGQGETGTRGGCGHNSAWPRGIFFGGSPFAPFAVYWLPAVWLQAPQPETDFRGLQEAGKRVSIRRRHDLGQFQLELRAGAAAGAGAVYLCGGPGVMYLNNLTTQAHSCRPIGSHRIGHLRIHMHAMAERVCRCR